MADSEISHHVFPKMSENVSKWDFLDKKKAQEATWIVTEKIHGANFCFICDGNTIRCAKRKAILQSEDRFFQFQRIKERYSQKFRAEISLVLEIWRKGVSIIFSNASKGGIQDSAFVWRTFWWALWARGSSQSSSGKAHTKGNTVNEFSTCTN